MFRKFPFWMVVIACVVLGLCFGFYWVGFAPSSAKAPASPYAMTAMKTDTLHSAVSGSNSLSYPVSSKFAHPVLPASRPVSGGTLNPKVVLTGQQLYQGIKRIQQSRAGQPVPAGIPHASTPAILNPGQQRAIARMMETLGDKAKIKMNDLTHTVRHLEGDLQRLAANSKVYQKARTNGDFGGMALALAACIPKVLNIQKPSEEFFAEQIDPDALGMTHVTLQQTYQGSEVWGAEIGVHFNSKNEPIELSGVYAPTPSEIQDQPLEITGDQAIACAWKAIGQSGPGIKAPQAKTMVYWDLGQKPVLCYNVELSPGYAQSWQVFVSVSDGSIVHQYSGVRSASVAVTAPDLVNKSRTFHVWEDQGTYYAIDTTLASFDAANSNLPDEQTGGLIALDFRNQDTRDTSANLYYVTTEDVTQWDKAAVNLMAYFPQIYQYYQDTFQRNSFDNKGMVITCIVHFTWPNGNQIGDTQNENACWDPSANMIFFGDGDQLAGGKLPYAIDVAAHEYTHGVTGFEAGLIYETQSGALDEAFSDFFGCMVDREDWLLAEDIIPLGDNNGKIAMRDMSYPGNPEVTNPNPAIMAEYQNLSTDYDQGGVHINCGIPSYMMYLLAEGGNGYAVGKDKAEQLVYRARNEYLTQRSQFIDFRNALVSAARDLYGEGSPEIGACNQAADAVGITEENTPSPSPTTPGQVVEGEEMMLFLASDPSVGQDPFRDDYYYNLYLNYEGNSVPLTYRYVAATRPAVSGDGQWALYVDAYNDIYMTDGFNDNQITQSNVVRTIAMSKNLRYVVFTSIDYDNYIYVIDMEAPTADESFKAVPLQIPLISEYASSIDLAYADIMTFNFRSDYLIFDGLQDVQLSTGEKKEEWGMYSLRLSDFACDIVMQPEPDVEYGNPTFAHTDDSLLLADVAAKQNGQAVYSTAAIDFNQKKIGVLLSDTGILSRPSYRGDDQQIVYLYYDQNKRRFLIEEGTLGEDQISLDTGSMQILVQSTMELNHPVAFRAGEYVDQEGKIAADATLDFGTLNLGETTRKITSVRNDGNADLQILSISLTVDHPEWFSVSGVVQRIAPGEAMQLQVECTPDVEGLLDGALLIQSTDTTQPELSIALTGLVSGIVQVTPTPTGVPAPTATMTPQPTPVPTYTPAPQTGLQTIAAFEFDQPELGADGWSEVPGGFEGSENGKISANTYIGPSIPSSQDQVGLQITVNPGQVAFLYAASPVDTSGSPVLIRMTVRADAPNAAVALAVLKGNLSTGEDVDGGIATNIPATAGELIEKETRMTLVYEPDSSGRVTPVIQVAGTGEGSVHVFIDRLEIIRLESGTAYAGATFGKTPGLGGLVTQSASSVVDTRYEFDQIDLESNGWLEIPGGFTGAQAGEFVANSFVGQLIPSSLDKVGASIRVKKSEVEFLYAAQPVTASTPVLLRATLRASVPGVVVALAALRGDLSTGADVDGSIATHIPATAAQMTDQERTLTLLCPANLVGTITPVLQVLGSGDQTATVYIDRLEVYTLQEDNGYDGGLFGNP